MTENKHFSKKKISLACGMCFIIIAFAVSGMAQLRSQNDTSPAEPAASQNKIFDKGIEEPIYIVRLHNGNIAVFFADNPDVPIRTTDISQGTLRNYDREQLTDGITVYGNTELAMILEDFGS